jgi:hypothetical protein
MYRLTPRLTPGGHDSSDFEQKLPSHKGQDGLVVTHAAGGGFRPVLEIYDAKVTRWVARWPSLVALTWEEGVGSPGLRRLDAAVG